MVAALQYMSLDGDAFYAATEIAFVTPVTRQAREKATSRSTATASVVIITWFVRDNNKVDNLFEVFHVILNLITGQQDDDTIQSDSSRQHHSVQSSNSGRQL
ncbi:hypothetical protein LSAT2_004553 [Lamellibrachia satsuma]|nr:hypothetical protein LSAT2_004553 [Lamellibrachia satsuma]